AGACPAGGGGEAAGREVRLLLLRGFEALCARAAAAGHGEAPPSRACVEDCLRRLDGEVAAAAAALPPGALLLLVSGCGDWHRLRRLRESGPAARQGSRAREPRGGGPCKRGSARAPELAGSCRARVALTRVGEQDSAGSCRILRVDPGLGAGSCRVLQDSARPG
ncbi:unnamed protein product, partial [Prorocentrum cordatum]